MQNFSEKIKDIESELYALVNSISNLNNKYRTGIINDYFFRKAISSAMNNLLNLNFAIKKNSLMLSSVLKNMGFFNQYYKAINIINEISTLNGKNDEELNILPKKRMSSTILELPGITSEITSAFITLMDALKLEGFRNRALILNLFEDLKLSLEKFPGIEDITLKVKKIYSHCITNQETLIQHQKYREKVVDHLYLVFKEFQSKLHLDL